MWDDFLGLNRTKNEFFLEKNLVEICDRKNLFGKFYGIVENGAEVMAEQQRTREAYEHYAQSAQKKCLQMK